MGIIKDKIVHLVEKKARAKVAALAGEYVRARPEEREDIQAGIQFEKWLADACQEILEDNIGC